MIDRIKFTLIMNRKLEKGEIVSPGGYEIKVNEKNYGFDFSTSYISNCDNNVYFEAEHLDITSFPEAKEIDCKMIRKCVFTEFYIDTDENETIYPVNISNLTIFFDDGTYHEVTQKMLGNIVKLFEEQGGN